VGWGEGDVDGDGGGRWLGCRAKGYKTEYMDKEAEPGCGGHAIFALGGKGHEDGDGRRAI
jgi:hypothetical protein